MGGWDGRNSDLSTDRIDRFDIRKKEWETLKLRLPYKLNDSFALVCGEYVFLMGGDGPQFDRESSDDVWVRPLRDLLEGEVDEKVLKKKEIKEETSTEIMPVKRWG